MAAVGYASLPVIPVFDSISREIEKKIGQPLTKASKDAGEAIQKGVGGGVDAAAKDVEKAQYRVLKSTQELETAESKLAEQKLKSEAASKAVEAAARKRAEAEGKGIDAIEKAEQDLLKKRAAAEKASRDLASAEQSVERAMAESARAAESLTAKQKALDDASGDAGKSAGGLRDRLREMGAEAKDTGGMFDGLAGKVGTLAGAFAGIAGAGALFGTGMELSGEIDKMNRQLGLTGETAEYMGKQVTDVMRSGFGADVAVEAVGSLNSQFKNLGVAGEQTSAQLADNFAAFTNTFGVDMAEATQTAGQLITNGLAPDVETAADLMTTAFQRVPAAMRDELPEIINEYGVNFAALGFSGQEAFSMLVTQAENGKWALDKTGDALKEFTIRGSDMSASSVGAFEMLGLSADDMASKIATGGAGAREALEQTAAKLLEIEDPAERANTAIALFGTPLEDLSVDQIPSFLQGISGVEDSMEGFAGSSQALSDEISNSLQGRLERLKGTVQAVATDAFMRLWDVMEQNVIPAFQVVGDWVQRNSEWLGPLAATIGGAAAAWVLWTGAVKGWEIATKVATGVQAAFNAVMAANPIMLAAMAIAGLAAGLTYFFTQTETGRQLWAQFTEALGNGWDWVVEKFSAGWGWLRDNVFTPFGNFVTQTLWPALQSAWDGIKAGWDVLVGAFQWSWENVIKPTWDALVLAGQWLVTVLATMVFTPIVLAWEALSWAVQAAWVNVIKPTWDAIAAAANWLWQNVLVPAFNGIQVAFQAVGDGIMWVWNTLIRPTWDAVAAGANWLWQNVFVPVVDGIKWLWQSLGDGIRWVWDNVIQPVWNAISAGLNWLWDSVFAPVIGWIVDRWNWMGALLDQGRAFVVGTVFGGLKSGLDTLQGWFQVAVDAITRIWHGIKSAAAKPVRFVVDTVFNNGIRPAWNAVAKFTGLDELQPVGLGDLGNYAHGGVLPGYTPGRDPYNFVDPRTGTRVALSGGEGIMRPEWVRAVGGEAAVNQMNKAAISGGVHGVQKLLGGDASGFVRKFAKGGVFHPNGDTKRKEEVSDKVVDAQNFVRSQHGKPYQWGGVGNPSWDCSGLWSGIVQVINGGNGFGGRLFNTTSFMQNPGRFGFSPGLHGPVTVGVSDGHMAGTLGGINAESASMPKGVQLGGSAWGSDNAYFTNQYTMDAILGEFISGGGGGGGGFNLGAVVKGMWDSAIGKIGSWSGPGLIGQLPGAMLKTLAESAWNFIKERVGSFFGNGGEAGNRESWREMAMAAMRRNGFNADDPRQVEAMLDQIMSESGGIPNRNQEIVDINGTGASAGQGLLQIIPGTFADYRDPELPDDRTDPWANMNAALRYYRALYGTDLTTEWGHGHGYANGGVLPGYTPGRDVHRFFSPTGGALALSGGEAIMVPEWTRAVGGPAAVAAMNRAASGGRTGGSAGAFAGGGVFGAARGGFDAAVASLQAAANEIQSAFAGNDRGYAALAATLRNEQWAKAIVDGAAQLGKIADYTSLEGVAARSFASEMSDIAGMLGGKTISTVTSSLLDAEKQIWDAREGYASRTADVAEKEKAFESARKALADAEAASYDDEQKRSEAIKKATEDATKAESDLTEARRKSASALDMRIFDVAPQINGMLLQAAAATAAVPQVSGALAGLAAVAGPAGISVGVAVAGLSTAINLFKTIMTTIGDFVTSIFQAREKMFALTAQGLQQQHEWAKMVDDMRAKVIDLRVSWVEAQVALRDAAWKTRLAQADVVRAQLQGVKSVAEAEAKLEAERKRVARAALRNFDDLSLAYDRYRWMEYQGMVDRLGMQAAVTPEILALEAEVNAAKLTALANQRSASLAALQASWDQQKAALNLQQVQANLALQTQQLALMQSQFGGFGQAESLQAMNTAKLYEERSQIQGQIGKSFWRPSYWLTGAGSADKKRIAELDRLIAEREANGQGAGAPVKGTGRMSFFGYGDSASNAVKNSGYGAAEEAMWKFQEAQQLQQIELQQQQLEQQIEQNTLFEQYQQQVGALTAEIEALQAGASSAQYLADSYREDSPAVKAALETLARFEAERSSQYAAVGRGEKQVVEITVPQQDVYTREQMDLVLRSVQEIPELDARIRRVEAPATPGANVAMRNLIGG